VLWDGYYSNKKTAYIISPQQQIEKLKLVIERLKHKDVWSKRKDKVFNAARNNASVGYYMSKVEHLELLQKKYKSQLCCIGRVMSLLAVVVD
jgi:hypothetical protein